MPQLSTVNGGKIKTVAVPAPPRFRVPVGEIKHVRWGERDYEGATHTYSQKAGIRYERRVRNYLKERYRDVLITNRTLHFHDNSGYRTCIPDGVLLLEDGVVIVEIKLQHVPEAWWQLRRLYEPVLKVMYPSIPIRVVEICKTFDPHTPFPEVPRLLADLNDAGIDFGVFKWTP